MDHLRTVRSFEVTNDCQTSNPLRVELHSERPTGVTTIKLTDAHGQSIYLCRRTLDNINGAVKLYESQL